MQQYAWFSDYSQRGALKAWLKVDSGMGRLGVTAAQAKQILSENDGINWLGLLTHFASADEVDNPFTQKQIDVFSTVVTESKLQRSMANSSAVLAWPQARADWARPGIMLYGCNPLDRSIPDGVTLKPAMRVTAPLISVKHMRAGSGIGYAQTYICPEDMPVGYVACGYRDGVPRVLDSSATVAINDVLCPVIGRVSMDSLAVDLRGAPQAMIGTQAEKCSVD
jgi:alanine racemase